jgi:hypothetical protein
MTEETLHRERQIIIQDRQKQLRRQFIKDYMTKNIQKLLMVLHTHISPIFIVVILKK